MRGIWAFLVLWSVAILVISPPALASKYQSKNVKTLDYRLEQDTEAYRTARMAMEELYKNTLYDETKPYSDNPVIFYATYDLDGDKEDEIISYPTEDTHHVGVFCKNNSTICPHFIIKQTKDGPSIIAKIFANSVDVSNESENGFRKLKAFTMEDESLIDPEKFGFYEVYVMDEGKGTYINSMATSADKPKAGKP